MFVIQLKPDVGLNQYFSQFVDDNNNWTGSSAMFCEEWEFVGGCDTFWVFNSEHKAREVLHKIVDSDDKSLFSVREDNNVFSVIPLNELVWKN